MHVQNATTGYDTVNILHDVSLRAKRGEITCILGSNGAGKSTLVRMILGLTPARSGTITFGDTDITTLQTHRLISRGITCIPEGRKVFPKCSVAQNLRLGAYGVSSEFEIQKSLERVYALFPRLAERKTQVAGTMSGGEQAMVSIGRGLMSSPDMLIIDEPSLGLSPLFVSETFKTIQDINTSGTSILLIEQNVKQTLTISNYGYVFAQGRVVAEGAMDVLASNEAVHSAYFC
ncbi:MAG: ABC transporter ATP-binding protein [Pseudomonadota bacterium]